MSRKHDNDEMEKIGKRVEEWESKNDCQTVRNFWDNILMENFSDESVLRRSDEMGVSPKKIREWQSWDYEKNAPGCGSI